MEFLYEVEEPTLVKRESRVSKLGRVTGRLDSIETLGDYLTPSTVDEAHTSRQQIEKSDKMKKLFGTRPLPSTSPASSTSASSGSSASSSHYPSSSPSSSSSSKAAKIKKMTGRRLSVDAIQGLLTAATPEEAVHNGRLIESSDKVMQVLGHRPPTRMIMTVLTTQSSRSLSRRGSSNSIIVE